jgi:hypothetical protein
MLSSMPFIATLPDDLASRTASLFTVHGRYGNNALNGDCVDGGRKRRRGDRVAAVQNGGAQPCRSLGREVVDGWAFVLVGHRRFLLGGVSTSKKTSMAHLFNSGLLWVPVLLSRRSTRSGTHRRFTERMLH